MALSHVGMYSTGPQARVEMSESEWFDGLSLVGLSRHFRAVLDSRSLRFEDARGMGTAIELGSIDSLRQTDIQRFSRTWLIIGIALVISSFRVFIHPYSFVAGFSGIVSIGVYVSYKLPILAIDHNSGTRHLISGSQGDLLYLYQMLNRVMHGHTVGEARVEIKKSWMKREEGNVLNQFPSTNTPSFHSAIKLGIEAPAARFRYEYPSQGMTARRDPQNNPPSLSQSEPVPIESSLPFDASFGFDDPEPKGMEWSMFDDPSPANESVEAAMMSEPAKMSVWGTSEPELSTTEQSSSMMIRSASEAYPSNENPSFSLPSPTDAAVRDECRPGIVRRARARQVIRGSEGVGRRTSSMVSTGKPRYTSFIERLLVPTKNRSKNDVCEDSNTNPDEALPSLSSRFFSGQRLRLRADQGHQSEIQIDRGYRRREVKNTGQAAIERIVRAKRLGISESIGTQETIPRFSELRPSNYGDDGVGIPGIRYLK